MRNSAETTGGFERAFRMSGLEDNIVSFSPRNVTGIFDTARGVEYSPEEKAPAMGLASIFSM